MLKDSVSAVFNAITTMTSDAMSISSKPNLKDNPWVPPKDGRCIINELPAELLGYIFELGYLEEKHRAASGEHGDDSDDDRTFDTLSHSSVSSTSFERHIPTELLFSRICSHWRSVAIGLPVLWTTLEFKDLFHDFGQQRAYLERAKGAPLDVSIDCTFEEDDDHVEYEALQHASGRVESRVYGEMKQVMGIILPHASQWRSLEVMVSHYLLMQLVLESLGSLSEGAPLLETLQLYHYEDEQEDTNTSRFRPEYLKEQEFVLFHNKAPKLSRVALWGVHLNWSKTMFLAGLNEIELAYHAPDVRVTYRDFLRMLKASPQLVTLTLCESGPAGGPVEWLSSITDVSSDTREDGGTFFGPSTPGTSNIDASPMSHTIFSLRNLILAYLPIDYVIDLLDRISMPSLSSLALDFDEYALNETALLLTRLSTPYSEPGSSDRRSIFGNIDALKLSGLRTVENNAIHRACLELSNITQLNLNMEHVDWDWFSMLIDPIGLDPDGPPLSFDVRRDIVICPRLSILSITGVDSADLRELVAARKATGNPILELYVDQETPMEEEDLKWLKDNVEVFDFFQGSDSGLDDADESVLEVDLEEEDWADEFDVDPDDVEDEEEGDGEEWTDEDY
ncbi:hypothetical protein BC835DRAFT_1541445 [Cytidiella melzeri]|nr:hypothetical protein BC835DRAFT_1541445 [Cytidiella melzeri]